MIINLFGPCELGWIVIFSVFTYVCSLWHVVGNDANMRTVKMQFINRYLCTVLYSMYNIQCGSKKHFRIVSNIFSVLNGFRSSCKKKFHLFKVLKFFKSAHLILYSTVNFVVQSPTWSPTWSVKRASYFMLIAIYSVIGQTLLFIRLLKKQFRSLQYIPS